MPSTIDRLRELGAQYWKPVISLAGVFPAILSGLKEFSFLEKFIPGIGETSAMKWALIGVGVFVFVIVRFPRVGTAITRFILGPPPPPPDTQKMIFRGTLPYDEGDKLPSRQADADECRRRIEKNQFFILEGESGCGKSSILNAILIPEAKLKYRVIECRIADDPFGKLRAALLRQPYHRSERVSKRAIADAFKNAVEFYHDSEGNVDTSKSLLLCIDQFEELFVTVKDDVRDSFMKAVKEAVTSQQIKLLIAMRSDYTDLLSKLCREIDEKHEAFDLGNYYVLQTFSEERAKAVLDEMLEEVHADDALRKQEIDDFITELVHQLLRPPRDKRLYQGDRKTILPVELQTVGMTLERTGSNYFSIDGLREQGGTAGLMRRYIEDAKDYAHRKTLVSPESSLLILRQLISPAQTKWSQTALAIAESSKVSPQQAEEVLDAFEDQFLVKRLPPEETSGDNGEADRSPRYELIHEHLVQILSEAPDPFLQKARDAEERLRFWTNRFEASKLSIVSSQKVSITSLVRRLFSYRIPVSEMIALWRFARNSDERKMLGRNLRAFFYRVIAILLIMSLPSTLYWAWTRTDTYQIQMIMSEAPVGRVASSQFGLISLIDKDKGEIIENWFRASFYYQGEESSVKAAIKITDAESKSSALDSIARVLAKEGKINEALNIAREITENMYKLRALSSIAETVVKAGKTDEALSAVRKIDDADYNSHVLAFIALALAKAGITSETKLLLDESSDLAQQIRAEHDSEVFALIAKGYARLREFRLARLSADQCLSSLDKLDAYATILLEYARPEVIRQMEKEEEEKKSRKDGSA